MSQQRTAVGPSSQPRRTTPTVAGPVGRKAPNAAAKKPAAGGPAKGRGAVNTKGKVILHSFLTALIRSVLASTALQFALCFFLFHLSFSSLFFPSSPPFSFCFFHLFLLMLPFHFSPSSISISSPPHSLSSLFFPSLLYIVYHLGGKVSAPSKPGSGSATPKKPTWTKQDEMARKIQTQFRGYRLAKELQLFPDHLHLITLR